MLRAAIHPLQIDRGRGTQYAVCLYSVMVPPMIGYSFSFSFPFAQTAAALSMELGR